MSVTQTCQFEELDQQSRDYLIHARQYAGRGMPGVFVPKQDATAVAGCIVGLVVILVVGVISFNILEEEPLAVAMLQTAGLLLGGWLILFAARVWSAANSSKYAGHFVYADADTLWEGNGSTITATDLSYLVEASGVQHFGKANAYTHTSVSVQTATGTRNFNVQSEARGRNLIVFLNMIAWMRSGGEGKAPADQRDGSEIDYKKLPPAIMGGLAKNMAERGEAPGDHSADALGLDVTDVPTPKKEGRASSSMLQYLLIIGVAVGGVLVFKQLNVGWRDDSIWESINKIDDQHKEKRAPWLRAYLADARNTKHQDDARKMLRDIYKSTVDRIRSGFIQAPPQNQFGIPLLPAPGNERVDAGLVDGLEVVLMELAELPLPLVSVSVHEKGGNNDSKDRDKEVMKSYTLALMNGVGKELVVFVEAPPDEKGMIDVTYDPTRDRKGNQWETTFTVVFRKSSDGEPMKTVIRTYPSTGNTITAIGESAAKLGVKTAGAKKLELQPLDDF